MSEENLSTSDYSPGMADTDQHAPFKPAIPSSNACPDTTNPLDERLNNVRHIDFLSPRSVDTLGVFTYTDSSDETHDVDNFIQLRKSLGTIQTSLRLTPQEVAHLDLN